MRVPRLSDYRGIVGDAKIAEIYRKGRRLYGKRVLEVSSTPYGGGVAEMQRSMVPLMNEMGLHVDWRTMVGSPDFFRVTRKFHNALQGDAIALTQKKMKIYEETNRLFSSFIHIDHDLVVVHDPQPLPMIRFYRKRQPWIWRCHIDLSKPNREAWHYLKGFLIEYDLAVYHMEEFAATHNPTEYRVIKPAIDPLSLKNMPLPKSTIKKYLRKIGVDPKRPIITQVSRFDKWKDPFGVLKIFELVRKEIDCQLLLVGNVALDDPEGQQIYEQISARVKGQEDAKVLMGLHDIVVNVVQRASDVVLQKSTREGFALTVSEALWKGVPVVASNIGGLPAQVIDGETGYLVDPYDYEVAAKRVLDLLSDRSLREKMGANGHRHVRENFLITRLIEDWIDLWSEMLL